MGFENLTIQTHNFETAARPLGFVRVNKPTFVVVLKDCSLYRLDWEDRVVIDLDCLALQTLANSQLNIYYSSKKNPWRQEDWQRCSVDFYSDLTREQQAIIRARTFKYNLLTGANQ